ncbi:hypothetical protein PUNSTDRAFT_97919 [Punctularia strigosozonata HHB-11173 SS5]|uniref:uncharacterized protein n=1 Tax=Punctularia strigosozonata (strain HHB-11173) TaxID=741275 RepID=UPI00044177BE|nr:uncharacterized protein PUNSTDRAFT_97919 [Punctularia strigosozonata HHB-11173 SS5]EIN12937.1 hypothetical protein PUNSTDRAFT_97919 [Punctularia strigosozonata HHB-11173 SS5]
MKTRRRTKAAAAAAGDDDDNASQAGTDDGQGVLNITLPNDVDIDSLATLLPDVSFTSLTPSGAVALMKLIQTQAMMVDNTQRELEECKAEGEKKDVELDQALQDKENTAQELETALQLANDELKTVKEERDRLAASQHTLQSQVASYNASQTSSSTELDTLRHRLDDSEREKRDLVAVITRLKEDITQRDEEIQTLRSNLKQARQDHQALESQVRELRSTETSTKFKIDSLAQQLQLAQSEVQRTSTELSSKTEEFAKYRRARHAEITQLQAKYDALQQTHGRTESTLKSLQTSHASQTHQLTAALAQVEDLKVKVAEQDARYSSEAAGLRRLVTMMEEREAGMKIIVDNYEAEWRKVGDAQERKEALLRDDIERERRRADDAEKRLEQMEKVFEKMDRGELPFPSVASGVPQTPGTPATPRYAGSPDVFMQGIMGLSPTVAMASRAQRSGRTFTEVYAEYIKLQEDFAKKTFEYDQMERTLTQVLAQIEERAPTLAQQRAEHDRAMAEASQLASQLADALAERDKQTAAAKDSTQKLKQSVQENEILQQQLDDLGRQVRTLLRELGRLQDPTIPPDEELAQDESTAPAENIEQVITNNLVLFRSISGLQEQNQKLLKIVRELGYKMENEEKEYRERMEQEQNEAVVEAMEMIQTLEARLEAQRKSHETTLQAYIKERDSLKAMLGRSSHVGPSLPNGEAAQINGVVPDSSDHARELAEMRERYESTQTDLVADAERNREQLAVVERDADRARAELARLSARAEILEERLRISNDQYQQKVHELDALSDRHQRLYEQCTRYDIECNRATEDLALVASKLEEMRNENANLRAEKAILQDIQDRLSEENKTLSLNVDHFSKLVTNIQKMQNDLERSGENDRRRLEAQIQMMETQVLDLRTQLTQERDTVRHLTLQKDLELRDLHAKVEKAHQELSKTRESLIGAETSKKHLEERVEDLSKQLQGNQEKLAVYERRSDGVPAQQMHAGMSREEQLEAEVAELRSSLKVAQVELTNARNHVQQFQEISQASESALASLSSTFDEYKTSSEAQIAKHEAEYTAMNEKLHAVQQELAQASQKYTELKSSYDSDRAAWASDKKTLEDTIVDMSTSEKHSESDRVLFEAELRQQQDRVKAAEDRYSREVIAHAETIKALETAKAQLSTAQNKATEGVAAAETAKANLIASENSWKQQKAALEKEIADLAARCKDLTSQNDTLHHHLESVSTQATRIRQAADASAPVSEDDQSDDTDSKLSELRSVVAYLRKEKEIVDLQLELSKQECLRLKSQIEHLSQTLQETRQALSEERERAVDAAASQAQHAELLEKINQLTILRESNATLRAESEANARRARDLDLKLQRLTTELEPAKEEARLAQAELSARDAQLQRLQEENKKWQERNSQLLTKYDRIDPAEVQSLKEEIEQLKKEKEQAVSEQEQRLAQLSKIQESYTKLKDAAQHNNGVFKKRMAAAQEKEVQLTKTISDLQTQVEALTSRYNDEQAGGAEELKRLQDQISKINQEKAALEAALNEAKNAASGPIGDSAELQSTIAELREERDRLLKEKETWLSHAPSEPSGDIAGSGQQWQAERDELIKARDEAVSQAQVAQANAQKALEEIKNVKSQSDKFQARIRELMKHRQADSEKAASQQEAAVAAAVQQARAEAQASTPAPPVEALLAKHAEELKALESRLNEKHAAELKTAVDNAVAEAKKHSPPTATDGDRDAAIAQALAKASEEFEAKLKAEIESATERGRLESAAKSRLKDQQLTKVQSKVKELEARIVEWKNAGILPEDATVSPTKPNTATAPATKPPTATAPAATRKQSVNAAAGGSAPAAPPAAGRGRGAAPGRGARGAARGGAAGRGASAAAAAAAAAATPTSGLAIAGAAGKRAREDGEASDDSGTKRLKPADGAAAKPVTLRRPPAT